jgi:putative ABC transport system permease protein
MTILSIATLIGAALSYILNNLWLRNFLNRVNLQAGTILLGTRILLLLGFVTIASQTIKAAWRKPVQILKAE